VKNQYLRQGPALYVALYLKFTKTHECPRRQIEGINLSGGCDANCTVVQDLSLLTLIEIIVPQ
jgi:hypothetical protein